MEKLHGLLDVKAESADSLWVNLSGEPTFKQMSTLSLRGVSPRRLTSLQHGDTQRGQQRTTAPVTRSRTARYPCEHHGQMARTTFETAWC